MHTAADVQMTRSKGCHVLRRGCQERIVRTPFCLCVRLSLCPAIQGKVSGEYSAVLCVHAGHRARKDADMNTNTMGWRFQWMHCLAISMSLQRF